MNMGISQWSVYATTSHLLHLFLTTHMTSYFQKKEIPDQWRTSYTVTITETMTSGTFGTMAWYACEVNSTISSRSLVLILNTISRKSLHYRIICSCCIQHYVVFERTSWLHSLCSENPWETSCTMPRRNSTTSRDAKFDSHILVQEKERRHHLYPLFFQSAFSH